MSVTSDSLLSPRQVATRLGLSPRTVRRAIESGDLPGFRLRSRLRVRPDDLEQWIDTCRCRVVASPRPRESDHGRAPATNGLRELLKQN
jgi:excisionase family DNA binding protein